jgi:hypothetical protein
MRKIKLRSTVSLLVIVEVITLLGMAEHDENIAAISAIAFRPQENLLGNGWKNSFNYQPPTKKDQPT